MAATKYAAHLSCTCSRRVRRKWLRSLDQLAKVLLPWGVAVQKDMFSRIALPLLSSLLLIPVACYLLAHGYHFLGYQGRCLPISSPSSRLNKPDSSSKNAFPTPILGPKRRESRRRSPAGTPDDYYVFHDLEFPGFNIDHVVLGPNGIFLVETKAKGEHHSRKTTSCLETDANFSRIF